MEELKIKVVCKQLDGSEIKKTVIFSSSNEVTFEDTESEEE